MSTKLTEHGARNPSSTGIILDCDSGKECHVDFVACVHCGKHWPVGASIRGIINKTTELGYCAKCDGIHCGASCEACVPRERQMEIIEGGIIVPGG